MAISFKDSLSEMKNKDEELWEQVIDMDYDFYEDYNDDNLSTVDKNKRIFLNPQQVNITQETNSQYIPFRMLRYYDGFDLASAKIQIYYINRENQYGISYVVNVYKSNKFIKFAWLVDDNVTMLDGTVKFEIQAVGKNSKGNSYVWKTRPNEDINIIKSLNGISFIEPDETWKEDFITRINDKILLAQNTAEEAKESANSASEQSSLALQYAEEAKTEVELLKDDIETEIQEQIDTVVNKVNKLAEGAVTTNTAAIEKLNGDASTVGSVAKAIADARVLIDADIDTVEGKTDSNAGEITAIMGRIDTAESDITGIKDDIAALQGIANDDHINGLINTALGVIENGSY